MAQKHTGPTTPFDGVFYPDGQRMRIVGEGNLANSLHDLLECLGRIEPLLTGESKINRSLLGTNRLELVPIVFQDPRPEHGRRCVPFRTRRHCLKVVYVS